MQIVEFRQSGKIGRQMWPSFLIFRVSDETEQLREWTHKGTSLLACRGEARP